MKKRQGSNASIQGPAAAKRAVISTESTISRNIYFIVILFYLTAMQKG
jgi:hypothetical protein